MSSFGLVALPPARNYPFDTVFGPEVSQELVYDDVVQHMPEGVVLYSLTAKRGTGETYVPPHSSPDVDFC